MSKMWKSWRHNWKKNWKDTRTRPHLTRMQKVRQIILSQKSSWNSSRWSATSINSSPAQWSGTKQGKGVTQHLTLATTLRTRKLSVRKIVGLSNLRLRSRTLYSIISESSSFNGRLQTENSRRTLFTRLKRQRWRRNSPRNTQLILTTRMLTRKETNSQLKRQTLLGRRSKSLQCESCKVWLSSTQRLGEKSSNLAGPTSNCCYRRRKTSSTREKGTHVSRSAE